MNTDDKNTNPSEEDDNIDSNIAKAVEDYDSYVPKKTTVIGGNTPSESSKDTDYKKGHAKETEKGNLANRIIHYVCECILEETDMQKKYNRRLKKEEDIDILYRGMVMAARRRRYQSMIGDASLENFKTLKFMDDFMYPHGCYVNSDDDALNVMLMPEPEAPVEETEWNSAVSDISAAFKNEVAGGVNLLNACGEITIDIAINRMVYGNEFYHLDDSNACVCPVVLDGGFKFFDSAYYYEKAFRVINRGVRKAISDSLK